MTQDEIIRMAREIGKNLETSEEGYRIWTYEALEAFAKLVAEKAFDEGYSIGELAGFKEGVKLERKIRKQA